MDTAVWGWARLLPVVLGDDALSAMPNLKRLMDEDARKNMFPSNYQKS